jgi:hypothetical protein
MRTVGDPRTHVTVVAGMHGMGVNTPIDAAVAATVGLASDVYIANGNILTRGL